MSKKSRKNRRQQKNQPKHDFVKTLTASKTPQKSLEPSESKLTLAPTDSPTIKITGQKKDIITTLAIAGVIIGLFFVISFVDQKTQLLNETGSIILNTFNLGL